MSAAIQTEGRWISAQSVVVGHEVRDRDGGWLRVVQIGRGPTTRPSLMFHYHDGRWSTVPRYADIEVK